MGDSPSLHPEASRLVGFMVDEAPLTPEEHEHIAHCEECSSRMASEAADELQKRREQEP